MRNYLDQMWGKALAAFATAVEDQAKPTKGQRA
jgi:hypothetical protein